MVARNQHELVKELNHIWNLKSKSKKKTYARQWNCLQYTIIQISEILAVQSTKTKQIGRAKR